jgi:hypothetical protein
MKPSGEPGAQRTEPQSTCVHPGSVLDRHPGGVVQGCLPCQGPSAHGIFIPCCKCHMCFFTETGEGDGAPRLTEPRAVDSDIESYDYFLSRVSTDHKKVRPHYPKSTVCKSVCRLVVRGCPLIPTWSLYNLDNGVEFFFSKRRHRRRSASTRIPTAARLRVESPVSESLRDTFSCPVSRFYVP